MSANQPVVRRDPEQNSSLGTFSRDQTFSQKIVTISYNGLVDFNENKKHCLILMHLLQSLVWKAGALEGSKLTSQVGVG